MNSFSALLLNNGDTTGPARYWAGGQGILTVWADFDGSGGGDITMEWLGPDGVTWVPANDTAGAPIFIEANGSVRFELPPGQIRGVANAVAPVVALAARVTE